MNKNNSSFILSLPEIQTFFEQNSQNVFTHTGLIQILNKNKKEWHLENEIESFEKNLSQFKILQYAKVEFKGLPVVNRWTKKGTPILEIIASVKKNGYFSHQTALYLNGVIEKLPSKPITLLNTVKNITQQANLLYNRKP